MKQKPKELDWSQKLKVLVTVAVADSLFAGKTRPITKDCSDVTIKHWKLIKYFIQSLITQQRAELLEEIRKIVEEQLFWYKGEDYGSITAREALNQVKNLLNKKDETN